MVIRLYVCFILLLLAPSLVAQQRLSAEQAVTVWYEQPQALFVVSLTSPAFDFPPYNWINSQTGQEQGLNITILRQLAKELDRPLYLIDGDFSNLASNQAAMELLRLGQANILAAAFKPEEASELLFFPARPLYKLDLGIYTLRHRIAEFTDWDSLINKQGLAYMPFSHSISGDPEFDDFAQENLAIEKASRFDIMLQLLLDEEVDYLILPTQVSEGLLFYYKLKSQVSSIQDLLPSVPVYLPFAWSNRNSELVSYVNRRLGEMSQNGELRHIKNSQLLRYLHYYKQQLQTGHLQLK